MDGDYRNEVYLKTQRTDPELPRKFLLASLSRVLPELNNRTN